MLIGPKLHTSLLNYIQIELQATKFIKSNTLGDHTKAKSRTNCNYCNADNMP